MQLVLFVSVAVKKRCLKTTHGGMVYHEYLCTASHLAFFQLTTSYTCSGICGINSHTSILLIGYAEVICRNSDFDMYQRHISKFAILGVVSNEAYEDVRKDAGSSGVLVVVLGDTWLWRKLGYSCNGGGIWYPNVSVVRCASTT